MVATIARVLHYRKLSYGFALGPHRFSTSPNWRSKSHPFWFARHYKDGARTLQIMRFEYWNFGH